MPRAGTPQESEIPAEPAAAAEGSGGDLPTAPGAAAEGDHMDLGDLLSAAIGY